MELNGNKNLCLTSGQATICVQDDGVLFKIKFWKSFTSKVIPYEDIVSVTIGPKWWIFPSFRILTKGDTEFYIEPGQNSGFNFKHNQITILRWKYKDWEKLALAITEKILITK